MTQLEAFGNEEYQEAGQEVEQTEQPFLYERPKGMQEKVIPKQPPYDLPDDVAAEIFDMVYVSFDYEKFRNFETNRELNQKNRAKILKSCKIQQLVIPIQVTLINGFMYIVDGKHRFSVWDELQLPIYFIVNPHYTEKEMSKLNGAGVIWNKGTFLESAVKGNKHSYIVFKSLMDKTGLSLDVVLHLFQHFQGIDQEQMNVDFKENKLTLNYIEDIEQFLFFYAQFKQYPQSNKANFVKAVLRAYNEPMVDNEFLEKQYRRNHANLRTVRLGSINKYLGAIMNDVYSAGAPQNKSVYFNVDKGRFHK